MILFAVHLLVLKPQDTWSAEIRNPTLAQKIHDSDKYSAIVIDESDGTILYQKNAMTKRHPASLTKVMTLYMIFEALSRGELKLQQKMKVSKVAASRSPTKLWLKPGEYITLETAIDALVVSSANDVATVVAESMASTEAEFAKKMTAKAQKLGMKDTVFRNASGLPHSKQITTAADMAKLAVAIKRDFPQYFDLFSKTSFKFRNKVKYTHNHVMRNYPHATGMKTGYINASGFNIITTASSKSGDLVAVVMGGQTSKIRDAHLVQLLDLSYAKVDDMKQIAKASAQNQKPSSDRNIDAFAVLAGSQDLYNIMHLEAENYDIKQDNNRKALAAAQKPPSIWQLAENIDVEDIDLLASFDEISQADSVFRAIAQ